VTDPIARYYHVLASLSQDTVRLVHHILHEETGPASYDNLRTSLLASHSNDEASAVGQKLYVMQAKMLEYCPAGESATAVFTYLFLQCLPWEIRVLLSEDDPADMRAIADKADRLIAMHVPQGHDTCAAVSSVKEPDQDLVAATGSARRKKKIPLPKRQQQQVGSGKRSGP
jgi:hypothetical protein